VFYINVDDTHSGLTEKLKIAEELGFNMLSEGYRGFSTAKFQDEIKKICNKDEAKGMVIILDTLKKFTDLMDKRKSSQFGELIRSFVVKGGTVICLAHINKNRDAGGKAIYAGTSDIIDDADCGYILDEISHDGGVKTVEFTNRKSRGNVINDVSYSYSTDDNISYHELLASASKVNPSLVGNIKSAEEQKSDAEIIESISECIQNGIEGKMALQDNVSQKTGVSKRAAVIVLEKYASGDYPLWVSTRGARGKLIYKLVVPQSQLPPSS